MKKSEEHELLARATAAARRVAGELQNQLATIPPQDRWLMEDVISAAEIVASAAETPPRKNRSTRKEA